MQVKELMRDAVSIGKDDSLADAAKTMSEKKIGSLIILEGGLIKGIITERDLLKNFGKKEKVSQVMTSPVITVSPKEQISDALEVMKQHQIKRLPVTKEGKVVGIISLTDIAAHADELEGDFFF